jgi:hypothetical protein
MYPQYNSSNNNKVHQPYSPYFTLFVYPPSLTSILPVTWPVLHSCPSLFKHLLIVRWDCSVGYLPISILYFIQFNPSVTLPYPFPPSHFNHFQRVSLCLVHTQMWYISLLFTIFLCFFFSFLGLLYLSHFQLQVLYIFVCIYVYIILIIFVLDLFSTYYRKHVHFGILNLANFT